MSQNLLNQLNRTSFEYEGKYYDVVDVKRQFEKNVVKTKQRVFVFFDNELIDFMSKIKTVERVEKPEVQPEKVEIHKTEVVNIVKHEIVLPAENKQITDKLFEMFNKLADNPTENDYKQAKAMSEMTESIVKVAQLNINLLRLQKSI